MIFKTNNSQKCEFQLIDMKKIGMEIEIGIVHRPKQLWIRWDRYKSFADSILIDYFGYYINRQRQIYTGYCFLASQARLSYHPITKLDLSYSAIYSLAKKCGINSNDADLIAKIFDKNKDKIYFLIIKKSGL